MNDIHRKEITFPMGKHKGEPVEMVLETDPQYAQWAVQQPWFSEKYPEIFQVIINNGQEPSETPYHNALQARFLDPEFIGRCKSLFGIPPRVSVNFEECGADVMLEYYDGGNREFSLVEIKPSLGDDYPAVLRTMKRLRGPASHPQVRQKVLIYCDFAARGATVEQVAQIFKASGITVVSFAEVEAQIVPSLESAPPAV